MQREDYVSIIQSICVATTLIVKLACLFHHCLTLRDWCRGSKIIGKQSI